MARLIRENIDRWFEINLDVDNRTLFMGSIHNDIESGESGVDSSMAEYFIKGMHVLESKGDKPITIIMNNPGGDWYHGMAIYDSINNSKCHCTIKVYGHAMSMGSIILQAADVRIMMPNSRFMIHYGYDGRYGHAKIFEKWAEECKRLNHDMENLYLDKIMSKEKEVGIPVMTKTFEGIVRKIREFDQLLTQEGEIKYTFSKKMEVRRGEYRNILKEMLNFDTILNPQDTISLGLADEVYDPTKIK